MRRSAAVAGANEALRPCRDGFATRPLSTLVLVSVLGLSFVHLVLPAGGLSGTALDAGFVVLLLTEVFALAVSRGTLFVSALTCGHLLMLAALLLPLLLQRTHGEHFWGNYLSFAVAMTVYVSSSNLRGDHLERAFLLFLRLFAVIFYVVVGATCVSLVSKGYPPPVYKYEFRTTLGASNNLGFFFFWVFFLLLTVPRKSLLDRVLLFLTPVMMFVTLSRGMFVGLAGGLACRLLAARRLTRAHVLVGLALVVAGGIAVHYADVGAVYDALFGRDSSDLSSGRFDIYRNAVATISENLLFGIGLGSFTIPSVGSDVEVWRAHNLVLELLLDGGFVGLGIYATMIVYLFAWLRRNRGRSHLVDGIYYLTIATLTHAMMEPSLFSANVDALFWTTIGLGFAIQREAARRRTSPAPPACLPCAAALLPAPGPGALRGA